MKGVKLLIVLVLTLPVPAFSLCNPNGYSVVYVNGILTSQDTADSNLNILQRRFLKYAHFQNVAFLMGYNPSHLGGLGDKLQSVAQAFNTSVSDYDLNNILRQIHEQVTTQKILLVGHSQGTFYTNEIYEYLIRHGVSKESIAVYNIATPASYVAGGGGYVTSSNDKVINFVRDSEIKGNVRVHADSYYTIGPVVATALRPNITIPKGPRYEEDNWGGHHFSDYLEGATDRIVSDIQGELSTLKSSDKNNAPDGCFTPPLKTIAQRTQGVLLAVADPLVESGASGVHVALNPAASIAGAARAGFTYAIGFLHKKTAVENPESQAAAVKQALQRKKKIASARTASSHTSNASARSATSTVPQQTPTSSKPADSAAQTPPSQTQTIEQTTAPVLPVPLSSRSEAQPITPGFGGGGSPAKIESSSSAAISTASSSRNVQHSERFALTSPADNSYIASTSIMFAGTATANARVSVSYDGVSASTTADSAGAWSLNVAAVEGGHTFAIDALKAEGGALGTVSRHVTIDTTPPALSAASAAECAHSLVSGTCVIPSSNVRVSWGDALGATYYAVAVDDALGATSTATSSGIAIAADATSTLRVVAYDEAGNSSTSTALTVQHISQPLVINEVGWAGTDTQPAAQWIELKNMSGYPIDLSHVTIVRSGGDPIALSDTIPAHSYFVVKREPFFSSGTAVVSPFSALSTTTAEQLSLAWIGSASTTVDQTPAVGACASWCAGSSRAVVGRNVQGFSDLALPLSMERKADASDGRLAASWQDVGFFESNYDSARADLWGSAGRANSSGPLDAGIVCNSMLLLPVAPPGPGFNTGSGCTYLSRFIAGDPAPQRAGGLYRGEIASSTAIMSRVVVGYGFSTSDKVPTDTPAGTRFFFAIWENRYGTNMSDTYAFDYYFTHGASSTLGISGPPHGNYAVFPFIYQPS